MFVNILIWVLLLISSFAGYFSPSKYPALQLTTIIYPILLLLTTVFFIYWLIIRSKISFIPLLIILIGAQNLKSNFQITFGESETQNNSEIDIISYNVQGFSKGTLSGKINTSDKVLDFLLNHSSDILILQEFHSKNRNLYEPLKEVRDTLGMKSYYYESYNNPKFDNLTGLVIYSKYEAVGKGRLKFDGSRTFGIYTDLLIGNDTIRVCNIHLASTNLSSSNLDFVTNPESSPDNTLTDQSANIYHKLSRAYTLREKQTKHLIDLIQNTPYKIILAGDFNDTPSSWAYKQFVSHFQDAFVEKGNGFSPTYAGPIPYLRIDYLFSCNDFEVRKYERIILKESDHYPISTTLMLN